MAKHVFQLAWVGKTDDAIQAEITMVDDKLGHNSNKEQATVIAAAVLSVVEKQTIYKINL